MNLPCLLYDPNCPMCLRFKQAISRMEFDTDLSFYPINDEEVLSEIDFIEPSSIEKEVHLLVSKSPQGVLVGHEVIEYLAKHNPTVKKLAWLLDTKVGEQASKAFYQSLNKIRRSLHNHCPKCKKG
ncbi:MAG: DCC1-like thiol-disulfide oxidoreductase family protein [Bdellovibrionota bacterium]|nr:DCC1-like thiol-disulfide oxidoreductase family protein [Bdellovibrionota bacterium]